MTQTQQQHQSEIDQSIRDRNAKSLEIEHWHYNELKRIAKFMVIVAIILCSLTLLIMYRL